MSFHSRQGMGSAGAEAEGGMSLDASEENSVLEIGTSAFAYRILCPAWTEPL